MELVFFFDRAVDRGEGIFFARAFTHWLVVNPIFSSERFFFRSIFSFRIKRNCSRVTVCSLKLNEDGKVVKKSWVTIESSVAIVDVDRLEFPAVLPLWVLAIRRSAWVGLISLSLSIDISLEQIDRHGISGKTTISASTRSKTVRHWWWHGCALLSFSTCSLRFSFRIISIRLSVCIGSISSSSSIDVSSWSRDGCESNVKSPRWISRRDQIAHPWRWDGFTLVVNRWYFICHWVEIHHTCVRWFKKGRASVVE